VQHAARAETTFRLETDPCLRSHRIVFASLESWCTAQTDCQQMHLWLIALQPMSKSQTYLETHRFP